jgi:hypothetical protein
MGCRNHPCWTNASGHSNQRERLLRHAVKIAWGYSLVETWTFVVRCYPSVQQRNPTQRTSDTKSRCSHFIATFLTRHPIVLTFDPLTTVFSGRWSNTWGVADSTIMRKCKLLFVNGCDCKNPIYKAREF